MSHDWLCLRMIICPALLAAGCAGLRPAELCRKNVIHARQLSQQGLDAVHRGQYGDAESCFLEAIEYCPSNAIARYQLANCLWKRGAREEAIEQLTESLTMPGGEDIEMLVELGYMHANVGNLDQAVRIAEYGMQQDPHNASVWQLHGDALYAHGRYRAALASFQRSLGYAPDDTRVLLAVADIYDQLERPGRVLATLELAEDLIPADVHVESLAVRKSLAFEKLARYDEAVQVLTVARHRQPLSPEGSVRLAEAQLSAGLLADADDTIRQALTTADGEQQALLQRLKGRVAVQRRDREQVVR